METIEVTNVVVVSNDVDVEIVVVELPPSRRISYDWYGLPEVNEDHIRNQDWYWK
jgi:hypothetical protein